MERLLKLRKQPTVAKIRMKNCVQIIAECSTIIPAAGKAE